MEGGLGCTSKRTATEQKNAFHAIIKNAYGEDSEEAETKLMEVQETLNVMLEAHEAVDDQEEPMVLNSDSMLQLMTESGVSEEKAARIGQAYTEEFGNEPPAAQYLIDEKALVANEKKKKEQELVQQVEVLQQQLEDQRVLTGEDSGDTVKTYDVILRVKPEKVNQIKSELINGKKCLVIPMEEDEHANVNGVNTVV